MYNPYGEIFEELEQNEALLVFYVIYLAFIAVMAVAFGVISYIFSSKGMYTIAKRRGIENPWLAWVPVGNMWLLGCISDQFRSLAYGEVTNRRRKLLVWNIVLVVGVLLYVAVVCLLVLSAAIHQDGDQAGLAALVMVLGLYGYLAIAVVVTVMQYKCYFDLFRSCDPSKSVLYLILSIFVTVPLPFFIYSCRNKDLGMPPREQAKSPSNLPPCEF